MTSEVARNGVEYEQRYCAFIDILGFTQLIDRLRQDVAQAATLRDLLQTVHRPPRGDYIRSFAGSDIRAQSISDALCLSAACSPAGLSHMFYNLAALALELLEQGFFVRGAVVKGKLYHDDSIVFGEGLVRAYQLEQEVVRYPRIMVTRDIALEVWDDFVEKRDLGEFVDSLRQADDGPYFLHVLAMPEVEFQSQLHAEEREECVNRYNAMAEQIQGRFDEAIDNPRHFEKVQWFAKYWNRTLEPVSKDVRLISGPGLAGDPGIWG